MSDLLQTEFINVFKFIDDVSKTGRILSTAKIGDVYMHRLIIEPGVITGNVYHKQAFVTFFVESGSVLAVFEHVKTKQLRELEVRPGRNVIHIPPYIAHATKNIGDEPAALVFFSDIRFRSDDDFEYTVL